MKRDYLRKLGWGALAALAVLAAPNGWSADSTSPAAEAAKSGSTNAAWERRVAEIKFDAMPLGEVARRLGDRFPEVNFVVPENAANAPIIVTLHNVVLQEALDAIELSSEGQIRAMRKGNLVAFSASRAVSRSGKTDVQCRVFRLAPYLEGRSEKEADVAIQGLYEALDLAWNMLKKYERNVEPPELKIHRETKLLIAVGREKELAVLEQVVKELQGSVATSKVATGGKPAAEPIDVPAKPSPVRK